MNPSQYIKKAWREVNGIRQLVEINYQDSNWANGYEYHFNRLKATILSEGIAVGVFNEGNKLKYIFVLVLPRRQLHFILRLDVKSR
jgi:hypothetical protein